MCASRPSVCTACASLNDEPHASNRLRAVLASVSRDIETRFRDAGCDPELVLACQAGDRKACSEFFQAYRRDITRILARLIGNAADLDDAVQDTFIEIFRSIRSFRGESRLTTWLYRVATNVALQKLRHRKRSHEDVWAMPPEEATHLTPERDAAAHEAARRVTRLLDRLSPKKRIVFVLHEIEGLDAPEIAKIVSSNSLTVRTRLHYARKEFYRLAMIDRLLEAKP